MTLERIDGPEERQLIGIHDYLSVIDSFEKEEITPPGERIIEVYEELSDKANGGRFHVGEIEGWEIVMSCGDFGDLRINLKDGERNIGFECGADYSWRPTTTDAAPEDLEAIADLSERAKWV